MGSGYKWINSYNMFTKWIGLELSVLNQFNMLTKRVVLIHLQHDPYMINLNVKYVYFFVVSLYFNNKHILMGRTCVIQV